MRVDLREPATERLLAELVEASRAGLRLGRGQRRRRRRLGGRRVAGHGQRRGHARVVVVEVEAGEGGEVVVWHCGRGWGGGGRVGDGGAPSIRVGIVAHETSDYVQNASPASRGGGFVRLVDGVDVSAFGDEIAPRGLWPDVFVFLDDVPTAVEIHGVEKRFGSIYNELGDLTMEQLKRLSGLAAGTSI